MGIGSSGSTQKWVINTDGAIRPEKGISGLAAVVRNQQGQILHWWKKCSGKMTCNEAEYAAVVFALEQMSATYKDNKQKVLIILSDSRVMVDQMSGRAAVFAPGLRSAQARLRKLIGNFKIVTFHHIPRDHNRLADALAFEAVEGDFIMESPKSRKSPNLTLWDELISTWRIQ